MITTISALILPQRKRRASHRRFIAGTLQSVCTHTQVPTRSSSNVDNVTLESKDKLGISAKLGRSSLHDRINPNGFHTNKTAMPASEREPSELARRSSAYQTFRCFHPPCKKRAEKSAARILPVGARLLYRVAIAL